MNTQEIQKIADTERELAKGMLNALFLQAMNIPENANVKVGGVDEIVDKIINVALLEVSVIQAKAISNRPSSLTS